MGWLKQSTAADVELGPFVDDTDFKSVETALSLAQADCLLIKNGGAGAQKNSATSAAHLGGGHYKVPLDTTDTGTLGRLRVYVNKAGALPVWRDFVVLPANVFDSLVGGSDRLQVHADEITAGLITAAAIATDAIDGDAIAASAVTEIQNGLALATALQTVDDLVDDLEARLSAARAGYLDNLSGGAVATAAALAIVDDFLDTEIAAILAKVNNLPADPADDSDIDAQLAAIAGYLDTEIAAIKAKTDNLPAAPAAVGSAMTLADGAISEAKISSGGLNAIADALLKRDFAAVSGEAARSALNALRFLRNKWSVAGVTLTVTKEDDLTAAWTAAITKDAASDPVVGADPN